MATSTTRQRTTITLDEDVLRRTREFSKQRDMPFGKALNELIRIGLLNNPLPPREPFRVRPFHMGNMPGLDEDNISGLLDIAEGPLRR